MTVWRSVPKVIAALAAAGFLWFVTAPFPTFAAAPYFRACRRRIPLALPGMCFKIKISGGSESSPGRFRPPGSIRFSRRCWTFSVEFYTAIWELARNDSAQSLRRLHRRFVGRHGRGLADRRGAPRVVDLETLPGDRALAQRHVRQHRAGTEGVTWQTLAEASDLFEQAGQAFRDGMHAEAIRLALLALIARLEKQGLLRYDTTRTNREYQVELRHRSELAACFGQLARIYERVWYGRVPAGRAEAEQAISLCGSVINREDLAPE